jgi:hypothetical protein
VAAALLTARDDEPPEGRPEAAEASDERGEPRRECEEPREPPVDLSLRRLRNWLKGSFGGPRSDRPEEPR